jgi:hypothetical protein
MSIPQKNSRNKIIVLVSVGIAVIFCLCVGTAVVNLLRVTVNQDKVEAVIKDFMMAMKNKDAQTAMTFMSSRAKQAIDISKQISGLLKGNNYALFNGFKDITINSLAVSTGFNSDPNVPQGTVAQIAATVLYEDGTKGTLAVTLEEENSDWKIDYIHVTIPPDKK